MGGWLAVELNAFLLGEPNGGNTGDGCIERSKNLGWNDAG